MRDLGDGYGREPALVADIGRTMVRLGLTNGDGSLDHSTVREYDPRQQPTITSAISAFGVDSGVDRLPSRAAIAVSGVPRGDTISITNSRWIISRSGIASMLGSPPLIINDFAATAWALSSNQFSGSIDPLLGAPVRPGKPGTYCIIGVGSGLGVAMLNQDEHGFVSVVPTEAGHMGVMDGMPDDEGVLANLRPVKGALLGESLFSAAGLLSVYEALAKIRGSTHSKTLQQLLGPASESGDPLVREAFCVFGRAFWHFAGNMVLAYGAWDGVIFTGSIVARLRSMLQRSELSAHFIVPGPYERRLSQVPTATATMRHAELEGAAVALLVDGSRRALGAVTGAPRQTVPELANMPEAASPSPVWLRAAEVPATAGRRRSCF